jgi:tetratricopeptide (TPR) repeat protein
VKTPATEPAKSAGGAADHPSDEKTPEKDSEERKLLLTRLAQTLQLNENDQFLRKLSDGELALLQGRLESLQKFAEKQDEISGKCAACYVDLARLYHDSGQYARAAEALKAALAVEPESALAHCNLGEIYKHLNLVDDAIRELDLAKTLNPELTDAYINLGIIYDDYLINDQKALECYRRYLSLGGSDKQVIEWIKAIEKGS